MEGREKSATVGERRENPGKGRAGGGSSQASLSGILDDWVPCTPFSDHLFFLPCAAPPPVLLILNQYLLISVHMPTSLPQARGPSATRVRPSRPSS